MIQSIDHLVATSLKEYLNHKTLVDLRAFKTITGELYPYVDTKWANTNALGSAYQTWVYDQSVPGAVVPTAPSGMVVDYPNGRFLTTGAAPTGLSQEFSYNEFNYYLSSSPQGKLIFETNYLQSPVLQSATGYLPPYNFVLPAVFVKSFRTNSRDHALGGAVRSEWNFKLIVMAQTEFQLMSMAKMARDVRQEIFPLLEGSVLNGQGTLKDPNWSYQNEIDNMTDYGYITDSTFQIQENDIFTDKNPNMFVGIGNLEISYFSYPRTNLGLTGYLQLDDEDGFLRLNDT